MRALLIGGAALRSYLLLAAAALLLLATGCSGTKSASFSGPAGQPPSVLASAPPLFLLPPLPSVAPPAHAASTAQNQTINGADSFSQSGGAAVNGTGMDLSSDAGGIQWAMYRFVGSGDPLISLTTDLLNISGNSVWLGLADFTRGSWVISGPLPPGGSTVALSSRHLSPGGDLFFLVVTYDGAQITLNHSTVTYDVAPATFGISGVVLQGGSTAVPNVTLTLTPGGTTVQTNADGNYSFSGLAAGSYTITPSSASFTFSPTSAPANIVAADITGLDFAATAVAAPVTYTNDMKAVFDSHCVGCHNAGSPPGRQHLDTYADAKEYAPAALTAVQNNVMPPGSPLSDADKALFQAWVDGGLLE